MFPFPASSRPLAQKDTARREPPEKPLAVSLDVPCVLGHPAPRGAGTQKSLNPYGQAAGSGLLKTEGGPAPSQPSSPHAGVSGSA